MASPRVSEARTGGGAATIHEGEGEAWRRQLEPASHCSDHSLVQRPFMANGHAVQRPWRILTTPVEGRCYRYLSACASNKERHAALRCGCFAAQGERDRRTVGFWQEGGLVSSRQLSRRTILRGAFGVSLCLPWLETFAGRRAEAAAGRASRPDMWMYFPNGTGSFWFPPTAGMGTAWKLSPILEPLLPLKQKMLVLGSIGNWSAY